MRVLHIFPNFTLAREFLFKSAEDHPVIEINQPRLKLDLPTQTIYATVWAAPGDEYKHAGAIFSEVHFHCEPSETAKAYYQSLVRG